MSSQILVKINNFLKNRLIELSGTLLVLSSIFLLIVIASYSPGDPNFIYSPEIVEIENLGGFYGSVVSDFLLQSVGLISFLIVINLLFWGFRLITEKKIENFLPKIFFTLAYIIFGTTFINIFYYDSFWLIDNGNGGFIGRIVKENFYALITLNENLYIFFSLLLLTIIFFILSIELVFLAISSAKLVIFDTFIPDAGSNSFKVTTGP